VIHVISNPWLSDPTHRKAMTGESVLTLLHLLYVSVYKSWGPLWTDLQPANDTIQWHKGSILAPAWPSIRSLDSGRNCRMLRATMVRVSLIMIYVENCRLHHESSTPDPTNLSPTVSLSSLLYDNSNCIISSKGSKAYQRYVKYSALATDWMQANY